MNYKVKVKEVRTWTFLVSAKDADEAAYKAKGIAMTEDSPHDSTFEWPEVSELDTIVQTPDPLKASILKDAWGLKTKL